LFSASQGGVTQDWFASTRPYNSPKSIPSRLPGFKLVPMPPPADKNGKRFEEGSRKLVMPDGWAISHSNKHPVETIKLFDFYFSPIGPRLSIFGVEGQHYTLVDGKPVFKQSLLTGGKSSNSQLWAVGAQIPLGYRQDYEYERQWTFPSGLQGREMYMQGNYILLQFPGVNMTAKERAVYDRYFPELLTYMDEMAQSRVLGSKDVDKTWADYQKRLERLGYRKVLAAMQSAYFRQYVSK
jgi:putative aldouronate transport system substrate-binding protein